MHARHHFIKLSHRLGRHPEKISEKVLLFDLLHRLRPKSISSNLVRIGGTEDGGYLLPEKQLPGIEYVISPGVGDSVQFELDMLKRFGTKSILIDGSVKENVNWPPEFMFLPYFLGARNNANFLSLEEIIEKNNLFGKNLLLQMDIEGSEYEVLMRTNRKTLMAFSLIVIELHDLNLWIRNELFLRFFLPAIENLLLDFVPVHFHPNDAGGVTQVYGIDIPKTVEITLVRREEVELVGGFATIPHDLDRKNSSGPGIHMPFDLISRELSLA